MAEQVADEKAAENHIAELAPVRLVDPAIMDHRPVEVLVDQPLDRHRHAALRGGKVGIGIDAEPFGKVRDDESGIAEFLAIKLDPRCFSLGACEGGAYSVAFVFNAGHAQPGVELEAERANGGQSPRAG